jgi:hypothetical protein
VRWLTPLVAALTLGMGVTWGEATANAQSSPVSPPPNRSREEGGSGTAKVVGVAAIIIGTGGVVAGSFVLLAGAAKGQDQGQSQPLSIGYNGVNGRGAQPSSSSTSAQTDQTSFGKYDVAALTMGGGAILLAFGIGLFALGSSTGTTEASSRTATRSPNQTRIEPLIGPARAGMRLRF